MNTYYFLKVFEGSFDEAIEKTTAALAEEGFGVLTDIDVAATMKKKLDEDMPPYRILGACSPKFAFRALQAENMIGTMLPCNVIVRQAENGVVQIAAVDPIASMQAIENPELGDVALEVRSRLQRVIANL